MSFRALALVTMLMVASAAMLTALRDEAQGLDQVAVPDTELGGGAGGSAGDAVEVNSTLGANTSSDGARVEGGVSANVTPSQPGTGGILDNANWSFTPGLDDDDTLRWRTADGPVKAVTIAVRFVGPLGVLDPTGAVLEVDERRYNGSMGETDGRATFTVPYEDFQAGSHDVILRARLPDSMWAYYGHGEGIIQDAVAAPVHYQDRDNDGHPDDADNCKDTANEGQENQDGDLWGDACDADRDGDGASNQEESIAGSDPDNPTSTPDDPDADGFTTFQERQAGSDPRDPASTPDDPDADGHPTTVEDHHGSDPYNSASTPKDRDADGHDNRFDNCPDARNDQSDIDGDDIGDVCDEDDNDGPLGDQDQDGIANGEDSCPLTPDDGADYDGDGQADACDEDDDDDGTVDGADAFPFDPSEQSDTDGDGVGDNADADDDNDGLTDAVEASIGTNPRSADTDGDQFGDAEENNQGTDPNDPYDPPYRAISAGATIHGDGSITITWEPRMDPRVAYHRVYRLDPLTVVAEVHDGNQAMDATFPDADQLYAVQAVLGDEGPDPKAWATTPVYQEDRMEVLAEAGVDPENGAGGPRSTEPIEGPEPNQDAPGPLAVGAMVAVTSAAWARQRRRQ